MVVFCKDCNYKIHRNEKLYSEKHYGSSLCRRCQRKRDDSRRKIENNLKFDRTKVSHDRFYKVLPKIMPYVLVEILMRFGWKSRNKNIFGKFKYPKFHYNIEEEGWDIIIGVKPVCPKMKKKANKSVIKGLVFFNIEYKSGVGEWGRRFHEFVRQIKTRHAKTNIHHKGLPILLTFDKGFEEYADILKNEGIELIVLHKAVLDAHNLIEFEKYIEKTEKIMQKHFG